MKLFGYFRPCTTAKAALAVAGVLAIAGAVGSAIAMSPIVTPPIKWQGGWEAQASNSTGGGVKVADVPAGRNLIVTDIVATNFGSSVVNFSVYRGGSADCAVVGQQRLSFVSAPPNGSVHLPLGTGMGFGAGQQLCVTHSGGNVYFNFRGFLFTAATAPVS